MSEELLQTAPIWLGRYTYYRLGSTTLNQLRKKKIVGKISKAIENKKPDGLVVLPGGGVKAVIEYKLPSELNSRAKIEAAIKQELEVARCLCKLLIVSDGNKTFWINALSGREIKQNNKKISMVFDAGKIVNGSMTIEEKIDLETLIDQAEYSLTDTNDIIAEPQILDPTPLAKEVWQKIWINTGREPEKCLYNVVEIFIFKFLSDIAVLDYTNNFSSVYQIKEEKNNESALNRYADVCRKDIKKMFPAGDDGTTIFNGTIFVNEKGEANLSQANLFAQVLESFQKYDEKNGSFKYVTKEFKTRLYETFLRQSAGVKNLGQFFTPRNVVQAMVKMSDINMLNAGARICDPFCGVGGFILEAITMSERLFREFEPENGKISPQITILGFDKGTDEKDDERTIILAKANMLIYFSELLSRYHSKEHLESFANNAFNKVFHLLRTNLGTFGKIDEEPFDLILTNPPYVTTGSGSIKEALNSDICLSEYVQKSDGHKPYYADIGRGTQSLAIEWIIKNLKFGGQALVVVPDSLLMQSSVLDYLKENCIIQGLISLPVRTFYTTAQKTYILIVRKKEIKKMQETPVFTYLVSEIGETRDAQRYTKQNNQPVPNDLIEAVNLFNYFKIYNTVSDIPRCKLVSFEDFSEMDNWMIDRLWSLDEKQELGIIEEKASITQEEFMNVLTELSNYLEGALARKKPSCEKVSYKSMPLGELFDFPPIRGVTRKDILGNPGNIPVYGGRMTGIPIGYIKDNLGGVKYFSDCLGWNRQGSVGYVFWHRHKFATTDDHRPMILKEDYKNIVNLEYIRIQSEAVLLASGFTWGKTAGKEKIKDIYIEMPCDEEGNISLKAQDQYIERYKFVHEPQNALKNYLEILQHSIELEDNE